MSAKPEKRVAYYPLSINDELLDTQKVKFEDIQLGEFFVYVYGSEDYDKGFSRPVLYQKILTDHSVCDGVDEGEIRALNVAKGTDMFMHATDMVVPVEVTMSLSLSCFVEHTGPTG